MRIPKEEFEKASQIAEKIIKLSRNSIMVKMRFLDVALFNLDPKQEETTYMTDGRNLYYGVEHLLSRYLQSAALVMHDIMHILLHCIFRHFYVNTYAVDHTLWDLATDIAVENLIYELDLGVNSEPPAELRTIRTHVKEMTAEKIYRYLKGQSAAIRNKDLRSSFVVDDHSLWYRSHELQQFEETENSDSNDGNGSDNGSGTNSDTSIKQHEEARFMSIQQLAEMWESISKRVQVDMETASLGKVAGVGAGGLLQNLKAINRERYDYATFLKKFSTFGEAMKINDDEFDYIFYTYGLKKYGNMPLIEPLEYKEVKRIKEFVIAIDTSGSVAGDLVQRFLQKTYNILKQEDSFFTRFNLHIVQCDAVIQESVKITNQDEFDEYIKVMKLKGFGGTDFRPVFEYVNKMIENGEFTNLKGMIYFTDGYGTFPDKKPDYNTAFVFIRNKYDNPFVPPWAIKLVLEDEEI